MYYLQSRSPCFLPFMSYDSIICLLLREYFVVWLISSNKNAHFYNKNQSSKDLSLDFISGQISSIGCLTDDSSGSLNERLLLLSRVMKCLRIRPVGNVSGFSARMMRWLIIGNALISKDRLIGIVPPVAGRRRRAQSGCENIAKGEIIDVSPTRPHRTVGASTSAALKRTSSSGNDGSLPFELASGEWTLVKDRAGSSHHRRVHGHAVLLQFGLMDEISLDENKNEPSQPKNEWEPRSGHGSFHQSICLCRFSLWVVGEEIRSVPITVIPRLLFVVRIMQFLVNFRISQNRSAGDSDRVEFSAESVSVSVGVAMKLVVVFVPRLDFFASGFVRIRVQFFLHVYAGNRNSDG